MRSLRDLLQTLLSWLAATIAAWTQKEEPRVRPAHGPAHPWHYGHVKIHVAARPRAPSTVEAPPSLAEALRARATRPPLPPHLAALLANAPDVEPEFARRRPVALLAPLHALRVRVRVYNPRPVPSAPHGPARPTGASWALRMTRAMDALSEWLSLVTPAPRGKRH